MSAGLLACSSGGGSAVPQDSDAQDDCDVPLDGSAAPLAALGGSLLVRADATLQAAGSVVYDINPRTLQAIERFDDITWNGTIQRSPNGLLTALRIDGGFTAVRDRTGTELVRADGSGAYRWSHDSRYVFYDVFADGLYEIDTITMSTRRVVTSPGGTFAASFNVSPNRARMVWTHVDGTLLQLRTGPFDPTPATAEVPATSGQLLIEGVASGGAVLGCSFVDETTVLFAFDDADGGGLYTADLDTLQVERVLLQPDLIDFELAPDRSQVALTTFDAVLVADTTTWARRTIDCSGERNLGLAWDPAGQYVAFLRAAEQGPEMELLLAAADGSGAWRLLNVATGGVTTIAPPAVLVQRVTQAISWGG